MKWLALLFVILIGLFFLIQKPEKSAQSSQTHPTDESPAPEKNPGSQTPTAPFFTDYGSENQTAKQDLQNVADALQHFWLLIKNPDTLNVMSNETIMRSLTGQNPHQLRFIDQNHPFLNDNGELLDRWKTPLLFHPEGPKKIGLRSAGPDKTLFTADDVIVAP